ncbi:MAG: ABC transporter permease [Balneolaceae bacterium]|nr:MAG: ABC transporter permease [Balneolaceae bacterium]
MKTLLTIAWRNIWRHPARSSVMIIAIVVGLWAGVVTVGIMNGMMIQRTNYMIESEITHAQIHHPEFLSEGYSRLYIPDHGNITAWLDEDERVQSYTNRTLTDGMIQSAVKTSGIRIRGVDIEAERATTTFHENMTEGEYLDSDISNAVIVGEALAEAHNMDIGHRVVLTFENVDNELTSGAYNIVGFFRSASVNYDERNVFVRAEDFNRLLSPEPLVHEIAVMLNHEEMADGFVNDVNSTFSGIEAQTWRQLSPELSMIVELGGVMMVVITAIIMIALAFGILNTMLMALFERMRELGMLISIGMSRMRVFAMIMLESMILTFSGAIVGMGIAVLHLSYYKDAGMNIEVFAGGAAQLGWDHIIYPVLTTNEYVAILSVVICITLLASVYPAIKGVRVNPLEASKSN